MTAARSIPVLSHAVKTPPLWNVLLPAFHLGWIDFVYVNMCFKLQRWTEWANAQIWKNLMFQSYFSIFEIVYLQMACVFVGAAERRIWLNTLHMCPCTCSPKQKLLFPCAYRKHIKTEEDDSGQDIQLCVCLRACVRVCSGGPSCLYVSWRK